MMQGYYQQELDEISKEITAFNAGPLGFYEFQRLPFGLTNASGSFQRMRDDKCLKEKQTGLVVMHAW